MSDNGNWLNERRDILLKDLVKYFFESLAFFQGLKERTDKAGISFQGFHQWVGTETDRGLLWQMKDICHLLWDDTRKDQDPDGIMLDWIMGTLFHEAMKLKENTYMLERYRSRFPEAVARSGAVSDEEDSDKCELFFEETEKETRHSIKRIDCLFGRSFQLLERILQKDRDNPLLVRHLLEVVRNQGHTTLGPMGPEALLDKLFPNGLDQAWCLAGESYFEGGWFEEARDAFENALEINPESTEARNGLRLVERRVGEIDAALKREMENQSSMMA